MRVADLNWMQLEKLLESEDRAVLPVGSTEQHASLSLATDNVLAYKISVEAAEPLIVPVFPVVNYGMTPMFMGYPGTVSLSLETFGALLRDILSSIAHHGFRRVLIVNGHGGNRPAWPTLRDWAAGRGLALRIHDWWTGPQFLSKVREIDAPASHASWMENFPWTRLRSAPAPRAPKPMIDFDVLKSLPEGEIRGWLGDGSFGGTYQRSDDETFAIWRAGVEETRGLLDSGWDESAPGATRPPQSA
jgi:creatinine amidohydrolase